MNEYLVFFGSRAITHNPFLFCEYLLDMSAIQNELSELWIRVNLKWLKQGYGFFQSGAMTPRRNRHFARKVGITVLAIMIILVVVFVAMSGVIFPKAQAPVVLTSSTLSVGDSFTYKLAGYSVLGSPDAVTPVEFLKYNNTDYYQVNVTSIKGSQVSLETVWQFTNGTKIDSPQVIDLSTGATADLSGFIYLYSPNLNVSQPLYPQENSGLVVNSTSTTKFADSNRGTDYWSIEDEYVNTGDQTGSTLRNDFIGVYFDKSTGILDKQTRIEFFTNPAIELTITWDLVSSNVWTAQQNYYP